MFVTVEIEDHVAVVTMDRPPVNAIEITMGVELRDAFDGFNDNRDVRVAILTAAGDRAFMAGVDLQTVGHKPVEPPSYQIDPVRWPRDAMWAITDCAVPVIGAINGPALGAGLAFAACCDIIIASENATFGATEINVGVLGASAHLSMLVGRHKAREMFFTGEVVTATELHRLGSVRSVVTRADLLPDGTRARGRTGRQEPDRVAARQGVDEPSRTPPVAGGVPGRAELHRPDHAVRGRRGSPRRLLRAPRTQLEVEVSWR